MKILHYALWPAVTELHLLASRHYAFEGQCFVVAAGTVLTRSDVLEGFDSLNIDEPAAHMMLEAIPNDRELLQAGGSAIIAPDATIIAAAKAGDAALSASIDTARLAEGRLYLDTAGHYSRPDIFDTSRRLAGAPGCEAPVVTGDGPSLLNAPPWARTRCAGWRPASD